MPKKIKPTGKQKRNFLIHTIIFVIINGLTWAMYQGDSVEWVYPWPAWTTAAWGLSLVGHWCAVYTNYEDPGMDEFNRQLNDG